MKLSVWRRQMRRGLLARGAVSMQRPRWREKLAPRLFYRVYLVITRVAASHAGSMGSEHVKGSREKRSERKALRAIIFPALPRRARFVPRLRGKCRRDGTSMRSDAVWIVGIAGLFTGVLAAEVLR